jgi:hypothetical protein
VHGEKLCAYKILVKNSQRDILREDIKVDVRNVGCDEVT